MAPPAHRLRRRVYELLEPGSHDWAARAVDWALIGLVLVNVTAVVLESLPQIAARFALLFAVIEVVSVVAFTSEYVLRLWSAPEHAPLSDLPPWRARLRFAMQPQSIVDLLAIAPVYAAFFMSGNWRAFLIVRLFRFFKLARYSPGLASLVEAVYTERRALLASGVILMGTVLIAASLMHLAEHEAQPDKFGTIPDAMYWAVITLATVGYGDVVPITALGRGIASLTAVAGLIMLALPVGIIASAFAREIHRRDFVVTWSMVARVPLFTDLNADELSDIMRFLRSQSCEPDEIVVRRGEAADAMYFIAAGEVEIELPDKRITLGPGHFFGEIAVLRKSERTATVRARKHLKLLVLDAGDLQHLMDRSPRMAQRIREVAEKRVGAESPGGEIAPDIAQRGGASRQS
ncbi:MAG TPA: cyclic nucleotide-gated ion channel [Beijerinckiaceae bacterium]